MWHRKKRHRLGVKTKHRKALLRNLVRALALHRQIETTVARAKETSQIADQMVTLAKTGTLSARRQLISRLGSPEIAKLFMDQIAPRLQDRNGGYTRVLKMRNRAGDQAQTALVEFSVPIEAPQEAKPKKEKKSKPVKPAGEEKHVKPEKTPKAVEKPEQKKEKAKEKPDTEKRGGFLSKLRKFLTGEEEKK